MAREEEIIEASIDYQIATNPRCIAGEAFADSAREMNVNQSFIEGAKWADQHPSVDTVKKIICYALKYTNIMLADDLENGVEWELLIKKAMEK